MASTFMSDSDEEARIIAHEQSIRLLKEAGRDKMTWTLNASDGDAKAAAMILHPKSQIRWRRSPHSKRRASRHSRPWAAAKVSKSQDSATELEEASDGDAKAEGSKSQVKMIDEESIIVHAKNLQQPAAEGSKSQVKMIDEESIIVDAKNLQQPAAKGSKSQDSAKLLNQGLQEIIDMYLRYKFRKRPPHSKRRASRQDKMVSSTLNASEGDAEMETETKAKILKQPPTRMVVKPMAPTAFMSDSDEEARFIAHEQWKPFVLYFDD